MREYELRPKALDFVAKATGSDWETMRPQDVEIVDGDLAIHGVPIHQAELRARLGMQSIVRERHRAANWLSGDASLWSDVSTDT